MTKAQGPIWRFELPTGIIFGEGVRVELAEALRSHERVAIVSSPAGRKRIEADSSFAELLVHKGLVWIDGIQSNPDVDDTENLAGALLKQEISAVTAIGGGSAMDTAKAIAARLSCKKGESLRQLIATPALLDESRPLPLFAVPVTSGTGSEVTPFTTLWDGRARKKLSLEHPSIFPDYAYVDPELTYNLPESVTVSTGLDAFNQAAESLWNRNSSPFTRVLSLRAFAAAFDALPRLADMPGDGAARRLMMEASLLAGAAISQTRTALCHSISYPLTAHFGIPHGLACAFSMRAVLQLNSEHDDGRLVELAAYLNLPGIAALEKKLQLLFSRLQLAKRLRTHIPSLEALSALTGEMFTPGRADNNLAPVDTDVIKSILHESWRYVEDEDAT